MSPVTDAPAYFALAQLCEAVAEDEDRLDASRARRDEAIRRFIVEAEVRPGALERITGLSEGPYG